MCNISLQQEEYVDASQSSYLSSRTTHWFGCYLAEKQTQKSTIYIWALRIVYCVHLFAIEILKVVRGLTPSVMAELFSINVNPNTA